MFGVKERFRITALGLGVLALTGLSGISIIEAQVSVASDAVIAPGDIERIASQPARLLTMPDGRALRLEADRLTIRPADGGTALAIPLPESRIGAAVVALPDRRILIWGGTDAYGRLLADGLWLDAGSGQLEPAVIPTLPAGVGQNLTVLSDGQVLLTGGWNANRRLFEQAARWNPATGLRTDIATRLAPRYMQDSAIDAEGRVVLWGGLDEAFHPVDDVQRFDPGTSTFAHASMPVSDTGALSIAASSPARDADRVDIAHVVGVRFSTRIDPRTVSAATVSLVGPAGPVEASVAGVQGRLAFVTPKGDLLPGTRYTVAMAGVRGAAGQALPFTSFGFTTMALGVQAEQASTSSTAVADPATATARATVTSGPASASGVTMYRTTGATAVGDASTRKACAQDARRGFRLCRDKSYFEDGAWYPGQDNAGGPDGGHWRTNVSDMAPAEVVAAFPSRRRSRQTTLAVATGHSLSGQVRKVDGQPAAHVQVSAGKASTYTGADGAFTLAGLPAGQATLFVDGSTADDASHHYGQFEVGVVVENGATTLPYRMYVPRILDRDRIELPSPTTHDMVVTHPDMPGLEVRIPAGTVLRDHNGKVVTSFAIVPMPTDRAPYPTPVNFAVYFSMQPGGAAVQNVHSDQPQGITLTYPNYGHVPAGHEASFIAYTPTDGWRKYGKGEVTPDGSQLKAEAGVRLATLTSGSWDMSSQHPGDSDPSKPGGARSGDPVDLLSGTLVDNLTDISIKDVIPIGLSRQWHSVGSSALKDASAIQDTRGFGSWRSNYDTYVNGVWDNTGVRLPDGTLLSPFNQVATNPGGDRSWAYGGNVAAYVGTTMDARLGVTQCDSAVEGECYVVITPDKTQYYFSPYGGLYEIRDRFDNRVQIIRSGGLIQQVVSPSGRYLSFQYNADNNISQVSDNIGRTWTYSYHKTTFPAGGWSAAGAGSSPTMASMYFLDAVTYPDLTVSRYTYNEDFTLPASGGTGTCPAALPGTLTTAVDRNGTTIMANTYCGVRLSRQTLADGGVYQFAYTGNGTETDVTDPLGHVRKVVFDASGYPSSDTYAAGTPLAQTTTFTRDASGLMLSSTDPLNRTTSYTWDGRGNPLTVTRLAGTSAAVTQSFSWTADSRPLSRTDELGHVTRFNYLDGCLSSVIDAMGQTSTVQCDAQGRPTLLTDALGHATRLDYLNGDLHAVTDALGRTATFATDSIGRLTSVTDPLGNVVLSGYDTNDRLVASVDARGKSMSYVYDNEGHVTRVGLPNTGAIAYAYDPRYRLKQRTDALHQAETWTYDKGGNVQTYTDRKGQVTTYAATDALDRFTKVTFADSSTITADSYDAASRLKQVTDSAYGTVGHTYDDLDRLTSESSPQGAMAYSYYANGLRKSMTAASQPVVNYAYNANNLVSSIVQGSETVAFDYDASNRRKTLTLPNGIVGSYGYDDANQLLSIAYAKADKTAVGDIGYAYDNAGSRIGQTGSFAPNLLTPKTTAAGTFDLNNRQTAFNAQAITYDANGNLTNDGVRTYVWDARNRLVKITQGATEVATYSYDVAGRRTSKSLSGQSTRFLYDGPNAVQEMQGTSVNPILTGLSIDERFARNEGASRSYFLTDALASTVALADASGAVTQRYRYDAYGNVDTTGSATNPYQYTGRENDQTGLYYYRARYYSPARGAFIGEDPAGFAGGQASFYAYAGGSPQNFNDPTGRFLPVVLGIIGAAAAAIGDAAIQLSRGGCKKFDWIELGIASGGGFVVGALLPTVSTAGGLAGAMALSGVVNVAVYQATAAFSGSPTTKEGYLWSFSTGLLGGAMGGAAKLPTPWGYSGTAAGAAMVDASNTAAAVRATGIGSFIRSVTGGALESTSDPSGGSAAGCECSK